MNHNFIDVEYGFPTLDGNEMVGQDCAVSENGFLIASVCHGPMLGSAYQMHELRRSNARRIAACINFCKNMTTEELEI